jgi:hypothetical protein
MFLGLRRILDRASALRAQEELDILPMGWIISPEITAKEHADERPQQPWS